MIQGHWRPRYAASGGSSTRSGTLTRGGVEARGFSLTELMVVIGIIVLLAAILLTALRHVQVARKQAETEARMRQFAQACVAFQLDHGFYPGVLPDDVVADIPGFSGTENALLHLLGGYRVLAPEDVGTAVQTDYANFLAAANGTNSGVELTGTDAGGGNWKLAIDKRKIGEGPRINGKSYSPYFTPGQGDLAVVQGQFGEQADKALPDLVDAWDMPIGYLRSLRPRGPLVGTFGDVPQFTFAGLDPYIKARFLGEQSANELAGCILNFGPAIPPLQDTNLKRILEHPAVKDQARGAILVFSAGPDGIYWSQFDGPGAPNAGVLDISNAAQYPAKVLDDYDDVVMFAGG